MGHSRLPLGRLCLALWALGVPVPAQTTWVVDAAGGPSSQFTTIGAALAAATHGDTITVRAGLYLEPLITTKGVQIAGDPGVTIADSFYSATALMVTDLPAGRTFSLSGVTFAFPSVASLIRDCAGAVHLEAVRFPRQPVTILTLSNSSRVSMTDCVVEGNPSMHVRQSCVVLTDCQIDATGYLANAPAMVLDGGAQVTITGGTVTGAPAFFDHAEPGIDLLDGSVILAGRDTVVASGQGGTGAPVPAVRSRAGRVDVDPAVTLVATGGAAAITGPAVVTTRRIAAVCGDGLASRGTWTLDLHAPTGSPYCLVASLPTAKLATVWGDLWADPLATLVLGCGSVGPGDRVTLSIVLPALPRGVAVVAQGTVAVVGRVQLTTPSFNIVE